MLPLRHKEEYFVKYQNIVMEIQWTVLKRQLEDIWRWVCQSQMYGHDSCKIHYINKSKKPALP